MAQPHQDPALHHLYGAFYLRFVAGLVGPGRQNGHAVVRGELLIGGIQVGLVEAGAAHAGFGVVGNQQLRTAAIELEGVHLRP